MGGGRKVGGRRGKCRGRREEGGEMGGGRGRRRMEKEGGQECGGKRRKEGGGTMKEQRKEEAYCAVCSTPNENTVLSIATHIFC